MFRFDRTYHYSAVGRQMDFVRGASLSEGGKTYHRITFHNFQRHFKNRPFFKHGAGVVTTRAHADYIVTEYGTAYLYGKNLRQRARALIDIAHPNHREELERSAFERFHMYEFERTVY